MIDFYDSCSEGSDDKSLDIFDFDFSYAYEFHWNELSAFTCFSNGLFDENQPSFCDKFYKGCFHLITNPFFDDWK